MVSQTVHDNTSKWDTGELGRDEQHAARAGAFHETALDDALELQAISIRMPKELIRQYKLLAGYRGMGYQPLMREVLSRHVKGALQQILQEQLMAEEAKPARKPLTRLKKAA